MHAQRARRALRVREGARRARNAPYSQSSWGDPHDGPDVAAWGAPETLEIELDGLRVAMIHDSGTKDRRAARMRHAFPTADLVVFGHSHIPWDTEKDGQRLFNPGSPTEKRRQPHGTMGRLVIDAGVLVSAEIVPVS